MRSLTAAATIINIISNLPTCDVSIKRRLRSESLETREGVLHEGSRVIIASLIAVFIEGAQVRSEAIECSCCWRLMKSSCLLLSAYKTYNRFSLLMPGNLRSESS